MASLNIASAESVVKNAESVVKNILKQLINGESQAPAGMPIGEPSGDGLRKADGLGEAIAMAGLRDAIQSSKAMDGLVEAVKGVKSLLLQKGSMGDKGIAALARAFREGNVSTLLHLDVSDNNISEQGFAELTELLAGGVLSGLEHLNVSHNLIREEGSYKLARILQVGRLSSLQHVNLSHCYIGDEGLKTIAHAMQSEQFSCWSLQFLDMSANVFGEEGVVALSKALGMGRLPYLKHLNLSLNMFGERGTLALASVFNSGQLSGLTHLLLSRCSLTDGALPIAQAMEAGRLPSLQFLDLGYNYLGDEGSAALGRALRSGKMSKLQNLLLSQCGISPGSVRLIAEAIEAGEVWGLRQIDLSNNFLVSPSARTNMNSSIPSADLGRDHARVDIGSLSLANLIKKGHVDGLQVLDLSRCCMSDDGLIALAEEMEVGHLPKLQRFLARDNDIRSERGIETLVRAVESGNLPELQELDLGHNSIGDDMTMALASALEDSAAQSPLVRSLKERLSNQKTPVETLWHQLLLFLETYCGVKLKRTEGPGKIWNRYMERRSSHLMGDEELKEPIINDKWLFNILLVCVWFLAVFISHS